MDLLELEECVSSTSRLLCVLHLGIVAAPQKFSSYASSISLALGYCCSTPEDLLVR